ncbi:MAG: hypothetical protein IJI97_00185 [Clostridia bacterium]|nr:hypothetical protein [Clostridia bacterium]
MKQCLHREMGNGCADPSCDGTVRRTGWTAVGIDASTVICPAWTCDRCGAKFWSYFDQDNGDESYDPDEEGEE